METERLQFRRPTAADVPAIFERYASDPEVVRYMSFPRHRSLDDTRLFLELSDAQWASWDTGPLLAFSRADGVLLGSAGLHLDTTLGAGTGYLFARDAWGKGYATEALNAMVNLAAQRGLPALSAICHVDHRPSWHVMEKCGFERQRVLPRHMVFPNISPEPLDVYLYTRPL